MKSVLLAAPRLSGKTFLASAARLHDADLLLEGYGLPHGPEQTPARRASAHRLAMHAVGCPGVYVTDLDPTYLREAITGIAVGLVCAMPAAARHLRNAVLRNVLNPQATVDRLRATFVARAPHAVHQFESLRARLDPTPGRPSAVAVLAPIAVVYRS